ncbi:MAG: hypothetical protein MUC42_17985 [Bryobacter sp.]|nr:hypothetical protein [Bryobacter sp.]
MRPNLDSLQEEILGYLEAEHFVVFRCLSRAHDRAEFIYWDVERNPDYRVFLDCALKLGIRLVHFHSRDFRAHHREEGRRRSQGHPTHRLPGNLNVSFDFEGRIYHFDVQTDWYEEWHEILDEIEQPGPEEGGPAGYGGFYSNN